MASLHDGKNRYCDVSNKGKLIINLDNVNDNAFMQGWFCRNICKAVITKSSKAKTGNSEVLCKSLLTGEFSVPRKEFVKNFRDAKGNKIKIFTMRNNQEYTVWTPIQQPVFFMLLPGNCIGKIQGRTVAPGEYIMFMANEEGEIDKSSLFVINRKLARKALVVPSNALISRHLSSGRKVSAQAHEVIRDITGKRKGYSKSPLRNANRTFDKPSNISLQEEIAMGIDNNIAHSKGKRRLVSSNPVSKKKTDTESIKRGLDNTGTQPKRKLDVKPTRVQGIAKTENNCVIGMEVGSGNKTFKPDTNTIDTSNNSCVCGVDLQEQAWTVDVSGGDYWCVAKLLKTGKETPCGYVLEHDGIREKLKFSQVAEVCRMGKCGNMELLDGNKFKGKGIKLKGLPMEYVD